VPRTTGARPDPQADQILEIATRLGPARAHVRNPAGSAPVGRLVLGHGAGGGIGAPDLIAARAAAVQAGWQVVLVEQPWRVAGQRVAPAPARLDVGWLAVLTALHAPESGIGPAELPLVLGGRSAGARVACRTAAELAARAVCCLAFPLHPPGRPERSRAAELAAPPAAGIPVLVIQGERDPFGAPAEITALELAAVEVIGVSGDHSLGRTAVAAAAVGAVLAERLPAWSTP
jgi:predicted alpha/beta-hydrolase family hydrolase